jgi:hypothetical protein
MARALAALRKRPGLKPGKDLLHEPGCTDEQPCVHCRRRAYRRQRYQKTGKR